LGFTEKFINADLFCGHSYDVKRCENDMRLE